MAWDPVLVEIDANHVLVSSDGTLRDHHQLDMSPRMAGEIREGYRCINCLEEFEPHGLKPWPKNCPMCKFEVSDKQARRFGMEFVGNVHVGPTTSIEDELLIAEEMLERQRYAQLEHDIAVRKPQIIIPRTW